MALLVRSLVAVVVIASLLAASSRSASAYPSSVVFSPNGEAKPLGTFGALGYGATNLGPKISPSSSWFGLEVGLLPQWTYAGGGGGDQRPISFGGLEVGFDLIAPYGPSAIVKPVLNAKLGLITQGTYSPSVAVGLMEISPALPSMNFAYTAATKTLRFNGDTSYGRLTLGMGITAGVRSQFQGTFPTRDTRVALMAAYETPLLWKHLGFAIDHLGGTSEISSTYLATTFLVSEQLTLAAGVFFANDRTVSDQTYDGIFAALQASFDVTKLDK